MFRAKLVIGVAVASGLCALHARADDHYVAPDGDDAAAGTLDAPFATVERAEAASSPGDTVYLRGGVYRFSGTQATVGVAFTKSGQPDKPIHYVAFEGEVPIFDLFELMPQARVTGLDVHCSWIHLRGLELRGVRQLIVGDSWGVRIRGDHNVIEQLNVHDCEAPGIFITSGASNLILNCDSHHNYDPLEDGGNADGFGCHSSGGDNVLRGCRAYENSDDGFDFINAPGTCTAEGSWAFRNGYIPDTDMTGANGAGFKAGGFGEPPNVPATGVPRHVVRTCVAFANRAIGFYANHHPGGIDLLNDTAFDNPANFDMRTASGGTSSHRLRNNIAAAPGRDIVNFNGGSDDFNSWTLPVTVTSDDFASIDEAMALAPRQPDGSLPAVPFMHLVDGSDLIDRGEDIGLRFNGGAPDLGAYEWGESAQDPGMTGMDGGSPDASAGADAGTSAIGAGSGAQAGAEAGGTGAAPSTMAAGARGAGVLVPSAGTQPAGMAAPAAGATAGSGEPAQSGTSGASGCGCRVRPPRRGASAVLAWLVVLSLAIRRRVRRWARC